VADVNPALADGLRDVPSGKLASVVTCLEMTARPPLRPERANAPWTLQRIENPGAGWYHELYRRVGADWMWFSRLNMAPASLQSILASPDVQIYSLAVDGEDQGLLELDFREAGVCELAFFGVTHAVQGSGAGRFLMNRAIEHAWRRPINRFWVHTCTLDHPDALAFYLRSGFRAYARCVEIADDPRLTGVLPRHAASHVPIIEPPAGR
jgi:GNAT superfamily N-acetyltransferase